MEQISPRLRSWASILDPAARDQALATSRMPFIHPHVALMPDAHLGKGATVGSVIPTLGAIIPAAVGVDIGCGMIALRTQLTAQDLPSDRRAVRVAVEAAVPLSAGRYNREVSRGSTASRVADLERRAREAGVDPDRYARTWRLQLGTLGSGNHFIEVSLDEQDRVWLFLHSGSRGVGNKMAQHHIKVAQQLARQGRISLPDRDLAYLVEGTEEFAAYLRDLKWAQHFALLNREEMMDRLVGCVEEWVGQQVVPSETVNCFAGETLVLTRHGQRPIAELSGGHHELLGADGRWVKAPVSEFGSQPLMAVTLSRSGVKKTIYATAGHGWILRTRRGLLYDSTTRGLAAGDRLAFSFPEAPDGREVDPAVVARGFTCGDGSRSSANRSRANFCVEKDRSRFIAGGGAVERRGWTVVSVAATDRVETVYCATVDGAHAFTLADNILTRNCHHNYTARERHFGKDVWLSRKGAIDAGMGVRGLIPGSMGTRSYVVVGKGNAEALSSSPHGAGRQYSRAAARRTFTQDDLRAAMGDIEYRDTDAFVDEIPGAYKDIDVVMRDAADLVEVRHTLRQVVNVKGD